MFLDTKCFWTQNAFGPKMFLDTKCFLDPKCFCPQILLNPNNFWTQIFWIQIFYSTKKIFTKHFIWTKIFLHKFFRPTFFLGPKIVLGPNIFFRPNIFLDPQFRILILNVLWCNTGQNVLDIRVWLCCWPNLFPLLSLFILLLQFLLSPYRSYYSFLFSIECLSF